MTHVRLPSGRVFDTDQVARCEKTLDYERDWTAPTPVSRVTVGPILYDVVRVWWKGVTVKSPGEGAERFVGEDAAALIAWTESVPEIGK